MTNQQDLEGQKPKRKKGKTLKRIVAGVLLITSLGGAAYIGDRLNVADRYVNPIVYQSNEPASGFSQEPFDLEKVVIVNDEGQLETYFGNRETGDFFRVKENNRVGYSIDDVFRGVKEAVDGLYQDVKDYFDKSETESVK